jgi:hypothetical protein
MVPQAHAQPISVSPNRATGSAVGSLHVLAIERRLPSKILGSALQPVQSEALSGDCAYRAAPFKQLRGLSSRDTIRTDGLNM